MRDLRHISFEFERMKHNSRREKVSFSNKYFICRMEGNTRKNEEKKYAKLNSERLLMLKKYDLTTSVDSISIVYRYNFFLMNN